MNTDITKMEKSVERGRILTIDIGNTALKVSVFEGERCLVRIFGEEVIPVSVKEMLGAYNVAGIACCRVGDDASGIAEMARKLGNIPFMELDAVTPVPLRVDYDRFTLGNDRLAAVTGVAALGEDILLVDVGTAMTLDMVHGMSFIGGNISPGLQLRFESLHRFTRRLPLVTPDGHAPMLAHSTEEAIRSGVIRAVAYEIKATLDEIRIYYPGTRLVVTGGNMPSVSKYLTILGVSHSIDSQAVGRGLVRIFNYNNYFHIDE